MFVSRRVRCDDRHSCFVSIDAHRTSSRVRHHCVLLAEEEPVILLSADLSKAGHVSRRFCDNLHVDLVRVMMEEGGQPGRPL